MHKQAPKVMVHPANKDSGIRLPIKTIDDVRLVRAPFVFDETAELSIFQSGSLIPFDIRRIFNVHARTTTKRGRHAHKLCSQAMSCLVGGCRVTVEDGTRRGSWRLEHPSQLLIVPPLLWCEQDYDDSSTILMVMCDSDYDEDEYLRDYETFRAYRQSVMF